MRASHLVSLLLGEDPIVEEDDDSGFTSRPHLRSDPVARRAGESPVVPSTDQGVSVGYAFGALGLLLTIVVAFALPTFIPTPCPSALDCSRHLDMTKMALIAPGLLIAFMGLLVGARQAYRA